MKEPLDEEYLALCMHKNWNVSTQVKAPVFQDVSSFVTSQVGRNIEEAVLEETDKALHITINQTYEEMNEKSA